MSIGNNYSSLFSSLNGSYNFNSSMSSVVSQSAQIKNGSYGKLMKAYVNKVGNKAALNAYRSTGTTVSSASDLSTGSASDAASTSSTKSSTSAKKTSFLDSHLSSIGKTTSTTTGGAARAKAAAEAATGRVMNADGTTSVKTDTAATATTETSSAQAATAVDKYESMKSSWLDDHLKSYDQSATVQTAANNSVAIDTTA